MTFLCVADIINGMIIKNRGAIMKKSAFFENAKLLNDKFAIIPLMYGSLGLEYITGENLDADDIDILIPEIFVDDKWDIFKNALESEGYVLIDEHEHSFQKNDVCYAYAAVEELESFAGISMLETEQQNVDGVTFKVLSLEQYLKVYCASVKDGYRVNVRKKKDGEKIDFIKKHLKEDL